jgi:glycosyltransferase involved in cell wall biosynthesis
MPKISIIVPTYNSGRFIRRTILSVLSQFYTDWELLIIDDSSTDNTEELVNEFIKRDARIKFFKTLKNSGGPALPKNIGLENARGEYAVFLDHDDEWLPEKLNRQLELFDSSKNDKLGLVFCFVNIKDNYGKLLSKYKKGYRGNVIKQLANGNFILTSSCVMVRLSSLRKMVFFDVHFKIFDDWDMWLKLSEAGYEFDVVPQFLVNYIVHGNNACRGNDSKNRSEFIAIYEKHMTTFLKYNSKETARYHFYKKNYRLSRKYCFRNILSKEASWDQKIISFAYIVLPLFPDLENFFKKIFFKTKKLL